MFLSGSRTISYTLSRLRSSLSLPLLRLMSFFFPLLNYIPGLSSPSLRPARSFFLTSLLFSSTEDYIHGLSLSSARIYLARDPTKNYY